MPSRHPLRPVHRNLALAVAGAISLAACGVDQGVVSTAADRTLEREPAAAIDEVVTDKTTPPTPTTPQGGPDGDGATTDATAPPTSPSPTEPTLPAIIEPELFVSVPFEDVVDVDENKPSRDHDEFVAVAFTDIEQWWAEVYPEVYGEPFVPLEGGVYAGYPERSTEIPGCGQPVTQYEDLAQFAAFYCQIGDFMAYDDDDQEPSILTPLAQEFGDAVMGVVLAHEYAHAIQERIGALDRFLPTITTEQQADCFAGAWTGHAYGGDSELLRLGDRDLRTSLIAVLSVRDPVGTNQFVQGGHGSAFDRVGAFQVGFNEGPARCAELLDNPLPLMPNEFQQLADLERQGNASYDCSDDPDPNCTPAPLFLADDINEFLTLAAPGFTPLAPQPVADLSAVTCADGVPVAGLALLCVPDGFVYYDEPQVLELYNEFGDFVLGYVYGIAWAEAAQQAIGSRLTGEARVLANDCLVGAWVEDITLGANRSPQRESLVGTSPGDLDEAIRMAILIGDEGANVDVVGSPFEKIDSFRDGVLGGLAACDALL
ncbi:MAG: hypothetical protein QNJ12_14485 [Ilumatobacter sp.]|uniref:hypothetical protein n=1 Tax=Ilumatobacter sp. TaxID=1967498 RepID=UPI0026124F67|nr:hypothetical protein [Ilumatobacter sp.]MDJ0770005.1 hypothetical protein [Ilumatobacter sp.]